jgi:hypothetical protein
MELGDWEKSWEISWENMALFEWGFNGKIIGKGGKGWENPCKWKV